LFGTEAVLTEEIKHQSLHKIAEVSPCTSEAKEILVGIRQAQNGSKFAEVSS
jgi:hypothetical protein